MKKDLLSVLRKELESTFGRKILSSRDCLQMVDDIYHKTGYTVNANTLRRFFGLVKTNYSASPSTLTILSKYCGFNSIDEIEHISVAKPEEAQIGREEVLHYMVSLFKHMPTLEGHNPAMETLIQQTVLFLERNPSLTDRFQREIAKTPAGQYYYYELSVNMDRLNAYYADGLLHYMRARNTDDARIFAHSLMVMRYWLCEDYPKMEKHMAVLSGLTVSNSCPPHIFGRMIAARILYASYKQETCDKILADATKYHVSLVAGSRGIPIPTFPDFELAVCEALVLTNQEEEGAEYIRRGKSLLSFLKNGMTTNPFSMWESIINSRKNKSRKVESRKVLPGYTYNYYLCKRYNNLVLLTLLNAPRRQQKQLANLIEETGFQQMNNIRPVIKGTAPKK